MSRDTDAPIRHHHLRAMLKSPAHYLATRLGQAHDEPTADMQRGSGLHAMLGGTLVVGWPEGKQRRGKEYDEFVADNPETLVLTASDYALAVAMLGALLAHPVAGPLLREESAREETIVWGDRYRTTPDRVIRRPDGSVVVLEVKSAKTADPPRFLWTARRAYGYHTQAAWHARGVGSCEVLLLVVESAAPHAVSVIRVSPGILAAANEEIDEALAQIDACRKSDGWPGYNLDGIYSWEPDELDLQGSDDEAG